MRKYLLGLVLLGYAAFALADQDGSLSESYNSLIFFTYGMVRQICTVTGIGLCFGALIQYRQYRQNRVAVKLSAPVWLLVIGLLLIGIPRLPSNISEKLEDPDSAHAAIVSLENSGTSAAVSVSL